jgi:hypothetical protein
MKRILLILPIASILIAGCTANKSISKQPAVTHGTTTVSTNALTSREQVTARAFAEKVLNYMQNRDYGKVYDLWRDEDKAKVTRADYIKNTVGEIGNIEIQSWEIKELIEEENGASVQYVLKTNNPLFGSESNLLSLAKKGEKWYLVMSRDEKVIQRNIGDEIALAKLKFTVDGVTERQSFVKRNQTTSAKSGAKFIVVSISAINITNNGYDLPAEIFTLIDTKDRNFKSYGDVYSSVDNYLNQRTMAPGVMEQGVVVFEVPVDATSYSLYTAKAGTNEVYKVILE